MKSSTNNQESSLPIDNNFNIMVSPANKGEVRRGPYQIERIRQQEEGNIAAQLALSITKHDPKTGQDKPDPLPTFRELSRLDFYGEYLTRKPTYKESNFKYTGKANGGLTPSITIPGPDYDAIYGPKSSPTGNPREKQGPEHPHTLGGTWPTTDCFIDYRGY